MRRGDVVTVAATGDYGKPRPAVIVQTDALPAAHASVAVCQMTSDCSDAPDFRVTSDHDPTRTNRTARWPTRDDKDVARLNIALAFVMGLAD